jgi:kynurenine formamidase
LWALRDSSTVSVADLEKDSALKSSWLVCLITNGMLAAAVSSSQTKAPAPFDQLEIVELTHTLHEGFPFVPVPGVTFPFSLTPIATMETHGVAANRWEIHEHLGTQIDAPNHFTKGGAALETLQAADLIVPMVVIDFRDAAGRDVDAVLETRHLLEWEARHGRIPERSAVMLYTGWDARISDVSAYINADAKHVKHYPGIGVEAANWLIRNRSIWGVGVDTLSFDPGRDNDYLTHKAVLGAGKWAVEAVANLQDVPPTGATLFVGAPKVRGATGGPARLIALRPKSPQLDVGRLVGTWSNREPERIALADGTSLFLFKRFTFGHGRWRIQFTASADSTGQSKLYAGDFAGAYAIESYAALVQAFRARFQFSHRQVTVYQADLVRKLDAAKCGGGRWTRGEAKDVHATGCALLRIAPGDLCQAEYDLIDVVGDELHLGERPATGDLCTEARRPQRLSAPGLAKESS